MKTNKLTRSLTTLVSLGLLLGSVSFLHTAAFGEAMPVCAADEGVNDSNQLFKSDGKTVNIADLATAQKQAIYEADLARYNAVNAIVDNYLIENYMTEEAKNSKKSLEVIERSLFQTPNPSEKDTKAWYEKNKDRIPYPYDKIKGEIVKLLKQEDSGKKRDALLERIKKQSKFALLIKPPVAPVVNINSAGYPAEGNANAKVKIVEFADYQCGHCKAAAKIIKGVVDHYKDKILYIYMDFPLHGNEGPSFEHAAAAYCAQQQNKFWDFHYLVFAADHLDNNTAIAFAKQIGLDEAKFKACLATDAGRNRVKASRAEGERLGVSGTPAIYVNGKKINGYSQDALVEEIEKALAAK